MKKFELPFDLAALKSFNWRSLQKYTSAQSSADFNKFLEKLPQTTSKTLLTIVGITWAVAGALGLFTTIQMQKFSELRAELQEITALKPAVPVIKNAPVGGDDVKEFVEIASKIYSGLKLSGNDSSVTITAENTSAFGQFREAISHVPNGGKGWKADIEKLCVGRECQSNPLAVVLKVSKVSVDKPQ